LLKAGGESIFVAVDGEVYPVITDYRGSLIGLVDNKSEEILFLRHFDMLGRKSVSFNEIEKARAAVLERILSGALAIFIEFLNSWNRKC